MPLSWWRSAKTRLHGKGDGRHMVAASAAFFGEVNGVSVHEAGHAVVAAYLRLPLRSARVLPWDGNAVNAARVGGYVYVSSKMFATPKRAEAAIVRGDYDRILFTKMADHAVVSLAGLAADERLFGEAGPRDGYDYSGDEAGVRGIAEYLAIPSDRFAEWRRQQLERARAISQIEYVWSTVGDVTRALEEKGCVSGVAVRAMLRARRTNRATAPRPGYERVIARMSI